MSKEWILNSATNRFQLNFKRNVGPTSQHIRACEPKTLDDWERYYYEKVFPKEHLVELGRKLHVKITEVLTAEISTVSEEDCIDYIINLVINRTFDGYQTERQTIYGYLEQTLGVAIEPASDEWDRLFNVDFFIKIGKQHIGLQIKPVSDSSHISQIFKERLLIQTASHAKFTEQFGGKVFYVFSIKEGKQRVISNKEVIEEIRTEIKRIEKEET